MFDYSMNKFQKKMFILGYDVDPKTNSIIVTYADNSEVVMPYSVSQEKQLLSIMRKQIIEGAPYYDKLCEDLDVTGKANKLLLVLFAIFIGMVVGLCISGLFISAGLFALLVSPSLISRWKKYKENIAKIKQIEGRIDEYEKNVEFVENSSQFTNEKVMQPDVIFECSKNVQFIISAGIIADQYDRVKDDEDPSIDFATFDDLSYFESEEARQEMIALEEEHIQKGYENVSNREVPLINENTISELTLDDLNDLALSIKKSKKGKVYAKVGNWE